MTIFVEFSRGRANEPISVNPEHIVYFRATGDGRQTLIAVSSPSDKGGPYSVTVNHSYDEVKKIIQSGGIGEDIIPNV